MKDFTKIKGQLMHEVYQKISIDQNVDSTNTKKKINTCMYNNLIILLKNIFFTFKLVG